MPQLTSGTILEACCWPGLTNLVFLAARYFRLFSRNGNMLGKAFDQMEM